MHNCSHLLASPSCHTALTALLYRREETLGSGEFGEVFKGVLDTPYGPQEVAAKVLKAGSGDKGKAKFLQEAATMAQFRHPHIVRLLGAVTVDDPVSMVEHITCQHWSRPVDDGLCRHSAHSVCWSWSSYREGTSASTSHPSDLSGWNTSGPLLCRVGLCVVHWCMYETAPLYLQTWPPP